MNLNNISFPYPVLGSYDDILPAPSQPKVNIDQDKINHIFDITLESNNSEIDALVATDFADYVFEVTCDLTRYRRCYKSKTPQITILIPRKSVAGRILFNCTVTVKKDIINYVNSGFHSDYQGHTFNMEPGDLLAILANFHYVADLKYDKLKAVGTFMEIVESEDELPATILDKDKIELKLPKEMYEQYRDNPLINGKPEILHASLVLNSLTYALCKIDRYSSTKWAETILYRIQTEAELEEFREQDPEDWRVDKLAQILLGKTFERMFNFLITQDSNDNI